MKKFLKLIAENQPGAQDEFTVTLTDPVGGGRLGELNFEIGKDFSDFLVWRKDGIPAYEFATVLDDHLMGITEIVRGEDLLVSSARQCLLFDILKYTRPNFYHCKLMRGKDGTKLSKSSRLIPRLSPSC